VVAPCAVDDSSYGSTVLVQFVGMHLSVQNHQSTFRHEPFYQPLLSHNPNHRRLSITHNIRTDTEMSENDYITPETNFSLVTDMEQVELYSSTDAVNDDRLRVARSATQSRSPEKLMVQARRSVPIDLADNEECYVDDANALSPQLAKKVVQRAICVRMTTRVKRTFANNDYMGQAGIVDGLLVTAMHNISSGPNHDGDLETTILVLMEHGGSRHGIHGSFPECGILSSSLATVHIGTNTWDHGIDIAWGKWLGGPVPAVLDMSFQKVDYNFKYLVGTKVATAVYLDEVPPSAPDAGNVSAEEVGLICGPGDRVNIYTGEVTYVGQDHVAYNINTFKGFSGAVVFLVDGAEQSASVRQEDLGKVIAVHVGYDSGSDSNIGFKIGKSSPPPGT
jgi:hypothetical protein